MSLSHRTNYFTGDLNQNQREVLQQFFGVSHGNWRDLCDLMIRFKASNFTQLQTIIHNTFTNALSNCIDSWRQRCNEVEKQHAKAVATLKQHHEVTLSVAEKKFEKLKKKQDFLKDQRKALLFMVKNEEGKGKPGASHLANLQEELNALRKLHTKQTASLEKTAQKLDVAVEQLTEKTEKIQELQRALKRADSKISDLLDASIDDQSIDDHQHMKSKHLTTLTYYQTKLALSSGQSRTEPARPSTIVRTRTSSQSFTSEDEDSDGDDITRASMLSVRNPGGATNFKNAIHTVAISRELEKSNGAAISPKSKRSTPRKPESPKRPIQNTFAKPLPAGSTKSVAKSIIKLAKDQIKPGKSVTRKYVNGREIIVEDNRSQPSSKKSKRDRQTNVVLL